MSRSLMKMKKITQTLFIFSVFILFSSICSAEVLDHLTVTNEVNCQSCHDQKRKESKYDFVKSWTKSAHSTVGVTCIKCHLKKDLGQNDFYKALVSQKKDDAHAFIVKKPGSQEMRADFINICGDCHKDKLSEFKSSVHGNARLKNGRAVSCIDCHDPHRAAAPTSDKNSKLYKGEDLKTCGKCHKEMLETYMNTFHGKQLTLGNSLAPTCNYCHIGHELPKENTESVLHAQNVGNLCAGCHGESMVGSFGVDRMMIHNLNKASTGKVIHFQDPLSYGPFSIASFINSSYFLLIIGVVGFFTLLSTKDYIKKTRGANLHNKQRKNDKRMVKRFSIGWRLQHFFWACSFILLAITGLSLKFPDSTLSWLVVEILGGVAMRSSIHRIAALVFIITAIVHITPYILKRKSPKNMILTKKDFLDALLHLSYLFDRTDKMPLMGRYAWYQKLEYWASVIGACIVISTGILMWGFEPFIKLVPLPLIHYAQMIHGWEAVLAVLVILVHHLYHTVLNPVVFPMDFSWLTGKSKYEVMEHEHPLELMDIEGKKRKDVYSDDSEALK